MGRGSRAGRRLLGAVVYVALAVRLALLLCLQVIRVQLLFFFPPHTLDHHQHQDDHSQEAPHRGTHDDCHRGVPLWGHWGKGKRIVQLGRKSPASPAPQNMKGSDLTHLHRQDISQSQSSLDH